MSLLFPQVIPGFDVSRNYALQVPATLGIRKHCCETPRNSTPRNPHGEANRVRPRVDQDSDHRPATNRPARPPDLLKQRGSALRVLNLGGDNVDTSTPMGAMMFTVMAALAQMLVGLVALRSQAQSV